MYHIHVNLSLVTQEICFMSSMLTQEYRLTGKSPFGTSLVLVTRKCGKHTLALEDFLHYFCSHVHGPQQDSWPCLISSAVLPVPGMRATGIIVDSKQDWWTQIYSRSLYVDLSMWSLYVIYSRSLYVFCVAVISITV